MPHPPSSYYQPADYAGAYRQPYMPSAASVSRHRGGGADYTLVHGGRQVRIGPVAFWIVVGTLVIMGVWSIATGTYFAFTDDVLTRLIGRQAEMQFAYEDRIAELRAQVDRIASRQLLDQEQFEQKLEGLLRRQSILEQRTSTLSAAGDLMPTGSIRPGRAAVPVEQPKAPQPFAAPPKPSPISDTVIFVAPPDREARLESRGLPEGAARLASKTNAGGIEGVLARVTVALERVETRQSSTLNNLEESYDARARRMRSVLADLGVDVGKVPANAGAATGGPFVPVRPPHSDADAFERQLYRINLARTQVDRYSHTLISVPVRKPVFGEVDMSSPFGMRMDPFVKGPAIHAGIDMRGEPGDPVRATAAGTVTSAGWNGGYGKMVEIDHGNGLATRYGHLSAIDMQVGQTVRTGQVVGKIGSTGRSTGPHLHYETRVDGEAVDPQRFLRAGIRLGGL